MRQFVSIFGGSHTYSNALSPVQVAVVLEALRIVRSPEGATLRERSAANVARRRAGFTARHIGVLGAAGSRHGGCCGFCAGRPGPGPPTRKGGADECPVERPHP